MNLKKIRSEDLIFSNEIEDDRTNTYLTLNDYDWMNYNLSTRFKTEEMGVLEVEFEFFGFSTSQMNVKQTLNGKVHEITYEYPTDIFSKNLIKFLEKHIRYWNEEYAFNGEEEVIDFFNEVILVPRMMPIKTKVLPDYEINWNIKKESLELPKLEKNDIKLFNIK